MKKAFSSFTQATLFTIFSAVLLFSASATPVFAQSSPATVLSVTKISSIQKFALADNTFDGGWKWVFEITVPENETILKMKFADWVNRSGIITAGGNIQFYSAQSSNAFDQAHAISIDSANAYSGEMNLISDDNSSDSGRQIQITMETRVPVGSVSGSYATNYWIQSVDPDIATVSVSKTAISTASYSDLQVASTSDQTQKTTAVQTVVDGVKGATNALVAFISENGKYNVAISKGVASDSYTISTATFSQSVADASKLAADHLVADPVTAQITALPLTDVLTLGDKVAVGLASSTFMALTPDQKVLVTNSALLSADVSKIEELQALADAEVVAEANAETKVSAYESAPITTIAEITSAEALKDQATTAVDSVLNATAKTSFTDRISARSIVIASAKASMPTDLRGSYNITFTAGKSSYSLYMTVISEDLSTGIFSGTASSGVGYAPSWSLAGNTAGNHTTFHLVYTGAGAPYHLDNTGIILNGNMSGTSSGSGTFTFVATKQ